MSTPQSIINICSGVRLDSRYLHSIYFANETAQRSYFAGKVVKTFSAYSYLRKSWSIKVAATMEEAKSWTYLFFYNTSGGKYYYYFINQIEYVNDNTVELSLELDVIQTYFFNFELLRCFVERQHTETDYAGEHTVDEGLETGELITTYYEEVPLNDLCIMIASTFDPAHTTADNTRKVLAAKVGDCFSGLCISACLLSDYTTLGAKLVELDNAGKSDGIVTMWMYPKNLVALVDGESWTDGQATHLVSHCEPFFFEPGRPETLAGYTPKNNKLWTYPYCMLYITNSAGSSATYKYERFGSAGAPMFRVIGSPAPDGAVRLYPLNYNGEAHNYEAGITLGGFPTCAWNSDTYRIWLAQNQNQQGLAMLTGGAKIAAGIGTTLLTGGLAALAGGAGVAASGLSDIAGLLAQRKDREIEPPQAKGEMSSPVNVANNWHTFIGKRKCITPENARIIDDFFTMYGYKINRVQVPNMCARPKFTYVKTIGCKIKGSICNEDMTHIESIFDKGITFWRNGEQIADYTLDNAP